MTTESDLYKQSIELTEYSVDGGSSWSPLRGVFNDNTSNPVLHGLTDLRRITAVRRPALFSTGVYPSGVPCSSCGEIFAPEDFAYWNITPGNVLDQVLTSNLSQCYTCFNTKAPIDTPGECAWSRPASVLPEAKGFVRCKLKRGHDGSHFAGVAQSGTAVSWPQLTTSDR